MPFGHPLLSWLSTWAAEIINKYRPRNGRTAYELMTGHRVKHMIVGFGENILAQFTADKSAKDDHDSRWIDAYFLGVETASGSYLIANGDGVFKVANIRRHTSDTAFDAGILDAVAVTHSSYVSNGASSSSRKPVVVQAPVHMPDPERNVPVPRRIMLRQSDFAAHGFTAGCPGCEWLTHKVGHSRNHTEQCRSRMEEAMAQSEEGKTRMERNKERLDFNVAKMGIGMEELANPGATPTAKEGETGDIGREELQHDSEMHVESNTLLQHDSEMHVESNTLAQEPETTVELENAKAKRSDVRIATPDRAPATRRSSSDEGQVPYPKVRRLGEDAMDAEAETEGASAMGVDIDALNSRDMEVLDKIVKGVDIMEVFSPARVNQLAVKFGLVAGASLDLTNGYDSEKREDREKAWKKVVEDKPAMVVGSPPCTMFSLLQELNLAVHGKNAEWMKKFEERKTIAVRHIEFCCTL